MARRYVTVTSRRVEITTNEEVRQKHAKTMDQIARCFEKLSHFVTCFCSKTGLYLMVVYLVYLLNC